MYPNERRRDPCTALHPAPAPQLAVRLRRRRRRPTPLEICTAPELFARSTSLVEQTAHAVSGRYARANSQRGSQEGRPGLPSSVHGGRVRKGHAWSGRTYHISHRLGDRFRITIIVLVDLNVGTDIKRRHQPRFVPVLKAKATDVMRPTTGLHRPNARWQAFQVVQQPMPLGGLRNTTAPAASNPARLQTVLPGSTPKILMSIRCSSLHLPPQQ